ncbi:MAG: hypothetical protein DWG80_07080, partial [Chloroflexi bacterium]|nr:hypothetical protein [Chloroflexota bacterium]
MREIVTVADVPDNAGCEASLDARDTGGGMAAAVPSPARTTPRLLSVGTLLLALLAVVLEADASRAWVGLAVVALVLVEATERLLRRPECPRPEWLRSGLWACLATLACVAAAVALPLSWWLPVAVIIVVLYAALTLRGRLVTGITAAGSLAMLLLSSLPNLSEPGPGLAASEAAVVLAVALPAGAWLVCARSMRARRDRAALRGVVQRLRLAREEMERSEDALRRWNAELRSEVDRKTDALEERNQYLSIINAVSFALAEPMDDERSLEQAVRLVACLLGVRAAQAYTEVRPGDPIDLFVTVAPEDVHAP